MKSLTVCLVFVGLLGAVRAGFAAVPQIAPEQSRDPIMLVADGCGPGWYRGPGGACHRFGYGPGPGWWGPRRYGFCGGRRVWVGGPWGGHWAWARYC
ncbi:MAG: hypothetical protein ABSE20_21720 [Acetobacteraceae bacterium]|jgi:hypothetical protein